MGIMQNQNEAIKAIEAMVSDVALLRDNYKNGLTFERGVFALSKDAEKGIRRLLGAMEKFLEEFSEFTSNGDAGSENEEGEWVADHEPSENEGDGGQ